eukprot:1323221-Prymnesium_polylepis.1
MPSRLPALPPIKPKASSSSTSLAINNPSYASRPEMWHAVAMQQERLKDLGLPGAAPRRRLPKQPPPPPLSRPVCEDAADESDDEEIEAPRYALTLAQRMGLAEAPDPELTAPEWEVIAARSRAAEESRQPCVICCDDFRDQKQVLLSCGHVFHRECLTSWERYSRSRCCP